MRLFLIGEKEVAVRRMQKYREGLVKAIAEVGPFWKEQLRAAASWLLEQPHMHLGRMLESDMGQISESAAEKLRIVVFHALLQPMNDIFMQALVRNPEKQAKSATYAGMFFSLIEGIDILPKSYMTGSRQELVNIVLDVFINGVQP